MAERARMEHGATSIPDVGNDPLAGWGAAIHLGAAPAGAAPTVGESIITPTRIALFGNAGVGATAFVGGSRSALLQRLRQAFIDARRFTPGRYHPGPDE